MTSAFDDFVYKVKYLSFFVTRAFLFAILGILVLIVMLLAIYYGDMFLNVKTGIFLISRENLFQKQRKIIST